MCESACVCERGAGIHGQALGRGRVWAVALLAQEASLSTVFRKMVQSGVGDSFYIRMHFEMEPSPPSGLGFTRGDVFHVLDTLYPGPGQSHARGGHWLAVRMGRDLREKERGIIPSQSRCGPPTGTGHSITT